MLHGGWVGVRLGGKRSPRGHCDAAIRSLEDKLSRHRTFHLAPHSVAHALGDDALQQLPFNYRAVAATLTYAQPPIGLRVALVAPDDRERLEALPFAVQPVRHARKVEAAGASLLPPLLHLTIFLGDREVRAVVLRHRT